MRFQLQAIEQFPDVDEVAMRHRWGARECIRYSPYERYSCTENITEEHAKLALELAGSYWDAVQNGLAATEMLEMLQQIAEFSCCDFHRQEISSSGLASELAIRWFHETIYIDKAMQQEVLAFRSASVVKTPVYIEHQPLERPPRNLSGCTFVNEPKFFKLKTKTRKTLSSRLREPVDEKSKTTVKQGSVYMYTHQGSGFRGMVKIGHTINEVITRLNYWAKCGFGYPVLLCDQGVRHPRRLEQLVHQELSEYRYRLECCGVHGGTHVEWFNIDSDTAKSIISDWALWMRSEPYDQTGCLKPFWEDQVDHLVRNRVLITAQVMVYVLRQEELHQRTRNRLDELLMEDIRTVEIQRLQELMQNMRNCFNELLLEDKRRNAKVEVKEEKQPGAW